MGLRRSRYIGLRKTHLGHVTVAAAVDIIQLMSWLRGEGGMTTIRAKLGHLSRFSPFYSGLIALFDMVEGIS